MCVFSSHSFWTSSSLDVPAGVTQEEGHTRFPRPQRLASVAGSDLALDSDVTIKTSGIPRAEHERSHDRTLVQNVLQVWQSLTKALENEPEIMKMVLEIGSPSEAWRALSKIADETENVAYDRAKREFETLEIGVNESVSEYFAHVNIVLIKLERHNIITPHDRSSALY